MPDKKQLVFLPGSLCDGRVWTRQIEAFSKDYEISTPHLLEYASLDEMARAALVMAPARFSLVGFSMGGRIALEMMRFEPERIERIALFDTSVHPIGPDEAVKRQPLIDLAYQEGMAALAKQWLPRIANQSRLNDEAYMGLLTDMACHFTAEEYEREVRALLNRPDPRPVLASIKCPTLILAGANDPLSTPQRNRDMAAQIPHAELVILGGCAHFPMLENPDRTNEVLRRWLATD